MLQSGNQVADNARSEAGKGATGVVDIGCCILGKSNGLVVIVALGWMRWSGKSALEKTDALSFKPADCGDGRTVPLWDCRVRISALVSEMPRKGACEGSGS